jgi:hypothetical protein
MSIASVVFYPPLMQGKTDWNKNQKLAGTKRKLSAPIKYRRRLQLDHIKPANVNPSCPTEHC